MTVLTESSFAIDSLALDQSLGFQVHSIERLLLEQAKALAPEGNHHTWGAALHQGNQSWVGLDPETLQTPYSELMEMCQMVGPLAGSTVVDLGAGYGRLGLVLNALYPGVVFIGYELVRERVVEGQRIFRELNLTESTLIQQDLMDDKFILPPADIYFLYDYGKVSHIRHSLNQLSHMAEKKNFKLMARGKGIRSLIEMEFPWLTVHEVRHAQNFSIYTTSA